MTPEAARALLTVLAIYLAIGVIVAVPFVIAGVRRIDPAAQGTPWTFRALILPGVVALWPLVLRRWLSSRGLP